MVATFVSTSSTPTPKVTENRQTQLRVGRLTKAHGLKGAIKIELYTDEPERRFVPGAIFSLQVPEESPWHGKNIELNELRWYNSHPVAFFKGVDDRTAAETLIKAILWVEHDSSVLPDDPEAWYDHQLTGLRALRDGVEVGKVVRVDHMPAQDLLIIKTESGEVMVPFVKAIVPEVDIAAGTVILTPPAGLFEEIADDDDDAAAVTAESADEDTTDEDA
jgi:16S rRNA processing protein RimM